MGAMYEKGQTKRYSRVASFKGGGNKSNEAKGDSERRRISKRAKEGDIDAATDMLMKLREAEMRAPPMNPMVPGMRGMPMMKKGGKVKESKAMMKKEVAFMKKKGAPKSMIKHEEAEAKGNMRGKAKAKAKAKGYAAGGDLYTTPGGPARGKSGKIKKMAAGGMAGMIPKAGKKSPNSMGTSYSGGGRVKGPAMDGCAVKGKTRGRTM